MAHTKGTNSCLMRLGNNSIENSKSILQQIVPLLKQTKVPEALGEAVSYSTRPWVLLFCPSMEAMETAIIEDYATRKDTKLLESIRLCHVQDMNELRKVLACIHLPPCPDSNNDIVTWINQEKLGQPPVLMCVMDILDILLATDRNYDPNLPISEKHLYVRYDQLADTLALLTETCAYFNSYGRRTWQQAFGDKVPMATTALLVTDNGYLDTRPVVNNQQDLNQLAVRTKVLESLYRIITRYLDVVV